MADAPSYEDRARPLLRAALEVICFDAVSLIECCATMRGGRMLQEQSVAAYGEYLARENAGSGKPQ